MKHILIGVSWPYSNGPLHIGHLAGQYIVCDVFSRFQRMLGNKVLMVSGSDMHGTPITVKAEELGISEEKFVQGHHENFLKMFEQLSIKFDLFTTTHTQNHKEVTQNFVNVLEKQGFLLRQESEQFYDEKADRFLVDRYVEGTCPHCGYSPARGDQCDNCGHVLTPQELIDPKSKLTGTTPILKKATHLYFDLPQLQKNLEQYIESHQDWRKNTYEFSKAWLKEGMQPRAISRDMKWGVQVPVDGFTDKVVYVWFEAVIGYLSAAIEWAKINDKDWEDFWKSKNAEHYYFIGKDNIPFHSLFWPAQLMAYNKKYASKDLQDPLPLEKVNEPLLLPTNVVANMYLNIKGEKMSKSKGTFITAEDMIAQFGPDLVRYFFIRYAPESKDIDFEWDDLKTLNNNELVATLGNFIYRVLSYYVKRFGDSYQLNKKQYLTHQEIDKIFKETQILLKEPQFSKAIVAVLSLAQYGNQILTQKEPWKITSDNEAKEIMDEVLHIVLALAILLYPFIPKLAENIATQLGYTQTELSSLFSTWSFPAEEISKAITNPTPLIRKID